MGIEGMLSDLKCISTALGVINFKQTTQKERSQQGYACLTHEKSWNVPQ
jgi:hypothetical protein